MQQLARRWVPPSIPERPLLRWGLHRTLPVIACRIKTSTIGASRSAAASLS
jgi:hypothetical protein